jgi:hypothetical protein
VEKSNFNVWLAVNEDGDSAVSTDGASDAREKLVDDHGGAAVRTVKLAVTMALPEVAEATVEVEDEAGETQQVEAAAE